MKLKLRAHHLLCLLGFQGYGYDSEFVLNMKQINKERKNTDTTIQITDTPDDICKVCPNLKNNICENITKNNEIIKMDQEVLKHLNSNKQYMARDLFNKIQEIFKTTEDVKSICYNCSWHDKCLFYNNLD